MDKRGIHSGKAITYRIEGTCYICTSHCRDTRGYPLISIDGHMKGLHRYIWEQSRGRKIPEGMVIRHTCGNLVCINPLHLKLGTRADWLKELTFLERVTMRPRAKLSESDVMEIRTAGTSTLRELAQRYGVSLGTISSARLGRTWKYLNKVAPPSSPNYAKGNRNRCAKLTEDQVREIRADETSLLKELARRYGVTPGEIRHIKLGIRWAHLLNNKEQEAT